jgi:hypothetical protein
MTGTDDINVYCRRTFKICMSRSISLVHTIVSYSQNNPAAVKVFEFHGPSIRIQIDHAGTWSSRVYFGDYSPYLPQITPLVHFYLQVALPLSPAWCVLPDSHIKYTTLLFCHRRLIINRSVVEGWRSGWVVVRRDGSSISLRSDWSKFTTHLGNLRSRANHVTFRLFFSHFHSS